MEDWQNDDSEHMHLPLLTIICGITDSFERENCTHEHANGCMKHGHRYFPKCPTVGKSTMAEDGQ
jgi:hypothetical protein